MEASTPTSSSVTTAELTLVVDGRLAGAIIGKGGSRLREIKGTSGVQTIQLSQGDSAERTVRIIGPRDGVCRAYDLIARTLRAEADRSPATRGATPDERVRIAVPNALAALLLGKQGAGARRLRRMSGASIEVQEPAAGQKQRLVVCAGAPAAVAAAAAGIVDLASEREASRHQGFLSRWAFETDYNDHFETPARAYADVAPLLRACGADAHGVYDPYYCDGAVVRHLAALGLARVHNQNEDFYAVAAAGRVPAHGVLLTNPPYSGEHKQKLLAFLLAQRAAARPPPFLLLLPAWVAATDYWAGFVAALAETHEGAVAGAEGAVAGARAVAGAVAGAVVGAGAAAGAGTRRKPAWEENTGEGAGGAGRQAGRYAAPERKAGVFYVSPRERYAFAHPQATGHAASPFQAVWFCGGWRTDAERRRAMRALRPARKGGVLEVFRDGAMLQRRGHFAAGAKRKRAPSAPRAGAAAAAGADRLEEEKRART